MTGSEMVLAIIIGLIILILLVSLITVVSIAISRKKLKNVENIYLGKLSNTDSSIHDAMQYLELTNGIMQNKMEKN